MQTYSRQYEETGTTVFGVAVTGILVQGALMLTPLRVMEPANDEG